MKTLDRPPQMRPARWLSPALFALAALAFLLPFATVSCDGERTSFSGWQLVTRTVPDAGVVADSDCSDQPVALGSCVQQIASAPAMVTLGAVLFGLGLGAFGFARGPGWCALVGLVAIGYARVGAFMDDVDYRFGYMLLLSLLLGVWGLHVVRTLRRVQQKVRARPRRSRSCSPEPAAASPGLDRPKDTRSGTGFEDALGPCGQRAPHRPASRSTPVGKERLR